MNSTINKVLKTYDKDGNEVIILADEQGNEIAKTISNNIYEAREVVPVEATNILNKTQIKSLKKVPKKKARLEVTNQFLIKKETGETYVIKMGFLPNLEERVIKNMSGTFLSIAPEAFPDLITNIIVPFKLDGSIPEQFPYIIKENT